MSSPAYNADQDKLRKRYDGGEPVEEEDDVEVAPQRLPEVNPEVYKDVEPMLFRGFLHVPAEINGISFVFKSLNHHEFELLRFMVPQGDTRKANQKFYTLFLAYGVLMVDGVNVLLDRESHIPELAQLFTDLGEGSILKIVRHMSEVNRRSNRAVILTEAYSMEVSSRLRWAQLQGSDLTSTAVTGFQGTSSLGFNWAQLTWLAMNHYQDSKELAEREWENAKFVASAMAGKGMNRVHSQDKRRRNQEQEERLERRDKILRFALLGESMEKGPKAGTVQVARTVEELQTQLAKDLKGEKDWHDLVVQAYEDRARDEREDRSRRLQEYQRNFDEKYGTEAVLGQTSMKGLTPEEVQFQISRRRQLAAQRLSAQQVHPELTDPKMGEFVQKWDQVSHTNRDPSEVAFVPVSNRTTGVPFNSRNRK